MKEANYVFATVQYYRNIIDNLSVDYAPVCVHTVNVSVSNIGIHSVEVDWTPGRIESEWQVVIGPAGFNPETAGAGALGFPEDGVVQFHHALLGSRRTDEPRIERVVEDWLVCTPAMWVVVDVLLYLEGCACLLHLHAEDDV